MISLSPILALVYVVFLLCFNTLLHLVDQCDLISYVFWIFSANDKHKLSIQSSPNICRTACAEGSDLRWASASAVYIFGALTCSSWATLPCFVSPRSRVWAGALVTLKDWIEVDGQIQKRLHKSALKYPKWWTNNPSTWYGTRTAVSCGIHGCFYSLAHFKSTGQTKGGGGAPLLISLLRSFSGGQRGEERRAIVFHCPSTTRGMRRLKR